MEIGELVGYVPSTAHALEPNALGDYPWVIGWKTGKLARNSSGESTEEIEELTGRRLQVIMETLRRQPAESADRQKIVLIKPNCCWDATVASLGVDGTLNLDVKSTKGGVTLHYENVPIDETRLKPHTCHSLQPKELEEGGN